MSKTSGVFVTLEGGDGAGKSTLLSKITNAFIEKSIEHYCTREPGGTLVSEAIREVILNPNHHMESLTELLLYEASRHEHVQKVILPKLKQGIHILCDRYTTSSLAYQGYGRNLGFDLVNQLNSIATNDLKPNITIWLKIDPKVAKLRAEQRGKKDRLETESDDFHQKVFNGFLEISQKEKDSFIILDATQKPDDIFNALTSHSLWRKYFS